MGSFFKHLRRILFRETFRLLMHDRALHSCQRPRYTISFLTRQVSFGFFSDFPPSVTHHPPRQPFSRTANPSDPTIRPGPTITSRSNILAISYEPTKTLFAIYLRRKPTAATSVEPVREDDQESEVLDCKLLEVVWDITSNGFLGKIA
jgi:hypothetical protein